MRRKGVSAPMLVRPVFTLTVCPFLCKYEIYAISSEIKILSSSTHISWSGNFLMNILTLILLIIFTIKIILHFIIIIISYYCYWLTLPM